MGLILLKLASPWPRVVSVIALPPRTAHLSIYTNYKQFEIYEIAAAENFNEPSTTMSK